jgi:hypothetical protein
MAEGLTTVLDLENPLITCAGKMHKGIYFKNDPHTKGAACHNII